MTERDPESVPGNAKNSTHPAKYLRSHVDSRVIFKSHLSDESRRGGSPHSVTSYHHPFGFAEAANAFDE
jgi:hypothetical protein